MSLNRNEFLDDEKVLLFIQKAMFEGSCNTQGKRNGLEYLDFVCYILITIILHLRSKSIGTNFEISKTFYATNLKDFFKIFLIKKVWQLFP